MMLKVTLVSAMVAASTAGTVDRCPAKVCKGTGTAIPVSTKVVKTCAASPANGLCFGGCTGTKGSVATCGGTSTKKIPAVTGVAASTKACAWEKGVVTACYNTCDTVKGCVEGVVTYKYGGTYMDGYVKAVTKVDAAANTPCTLAYAKLGVVVGAGPCMDVTKGFKLATCTGTRTDSVFDGLTAGTTCQNTVWTATSCKTQFDKPGAKCADGCTSTDATYTAQTPAVTFTLKAVNKVTGVAGTSKPCTTAAHYAAHPKQCTKTAVPETCTGTATTPEVKASAEGSSTAVAGNTVTVCATTFAARVGSAKSDCDAGCDYVAAVKSACTGTSTDTAKAAVTKAFTPLCDVACGKCFPGCNPPAVVPAVAPSPAKSSSASAATMAAATIALSAIAIVAL